MSVANVNTDEEVLLVAEADDKSLLSEIAKLKHKNERLRRKIAAKKKKLAALRGIEREG